MRPTRSRFAAIRTSTTTWRRWLPRPNPTAAVKKALHELAEEHRYWQRMDEVVAQLEAEGFSGTSDTRELAKRLFS